MTRPDEALEEEFRAILMRSMDIKRYVVEQDPEEQDVRRVLNLGHTVGHALESILIERGEPRPHGYCVLWGMVAELYLSHVALGFPEAALSQLSRYMKDYYGAPGFTCKDYDRLLERMRHDKKNTDGRISFTLLRHIGNPAAGSHVTDDEIREALDYLFSL